MRREPGGEVVVVQEANTHIWERDLDKGRGERNTVFLEEKKGHRAEVRPDVAKVAVELRCKRRRTRKVRRGGGGGRRRRRKVYSKLTQ
jgi:hypothetical protein